MKVKLFFLMLLPLRISSLLFVPGLGGSVIYDSIQKTVLWPPTIRDILRKDEYYKKIGTYYKNKKFVPKIKSSQVGLMNNTIDDIDVIPFWLNPLLKHSYMTEMYYNVKAQCPNLYMETMPWDFRIIGNVDYRQDLYRKLKLQMEKIRHENKKPVVIVAHSLGGLIIHDFLCKQDEKWKEYNVQELITINSPWGGSFSALKMILTDKVELFVSGNENSLIRIPNANEYSGILGSIPHPIIKGPFYNEDYKDILSKYWLHYRDLSTNVLKNANVRTSIIFSNHLDTPVSIVKKRNNYYEFLYGKGDGIIDEKSLLLPLSWKNANEFVSIVNINDDHTKILKNPKVLEYITSTL